MRTFITYGGFIALCTSVLPGCARMVAENVRSGSVMVEPVSLKRPVLTLAEVAVSAECQKLGSPDDCHRYWCGGNNGTKVFDLGDLHIHCGPQRCLEATLAVSRKLRHVSCKQEERVDMNPVPPRRPSPALDDEPEESNPGS